MRKRLKINDNKIKMETLEEIQKDYDERLRILLEFLTNSKKGRELARDKYRKQESDIENTLRILIDTLIAKLSDLTKEKIEDINANISFQLSISASFIRTHFIISDLILDGDLIEATVLIRKQLEALCRLHELDSKPLSELLNKTPNVKNILKGKSGTIYGILSEIAHSSSHRISSLLDTILKDDKVAISLIPSYSEYSHGAWDLDSFISIYYLFWKIEKMKIWYPRKNFKNESKNLSVVIQMAIENGIIVIEKQK